MASANLDSNTAELQRVTATGARLGSLAFLWQRHVRPHKLYLRRDLSMAVLLNPKVGTQTFRTLWYEGLQKLGSAPRVPAYYPVNKKRRLTFPPLPEYLHFLRNTAKYQCYAFVRNPYARFLSAWKQKFANCHLEESHLRCTARVLPSVRRFAAKHNLAGGEAGSPVPFETFLTWVESQEEGRRDHHWDTQRAVLNLDRIAYHRLFRIETEYTDGLMEVLTRAGVCADLVQERATRKVNSTPALKKPIYNEQLAERVYKLYRFDFEALGYEEDSWRDAA